MRRRVHPAAEVRTREDQRPGPAHGMGARTETAIGTSIQAVGTSIHSRTARQSSVPFGNPTDAGRVTT